MATKAVVVAGAGPAGASLGYLLARSGVEVTLLERQTDFARKFRGEGLLQSGMAALGEMGLLAEVARLPHVVIDRAEVLLNGSRLFALDVKARHVDGLSWARYE